MVNPEGEHRVARSSAQVKRLREWLDTRGIREKALKDRLSGAEKAMHANEKAQRADKRADKQSEKVKKRPKKRGRRRADEEDEGYNSAEDEEEVSRFEDALEADKMHEDCVTELKERLVRIERLVRGLTGSKGLSGWAKSVREAEKSELCAKVPAAKPEPPGLPTPRLGPGYPPRSRDHPVQPPREPTLGGR